MYCVVHVVTNIVLVPVWRVCGVLSCVIVADAVVPAGGGDGGDGGESKHGIR